MERGGGGDGYSAMVLLPTGQKLGRITVKKSPQIRAAGNSSAKFSSYIYNQKNFEEESNFFFKIASFYSIFIVFSAARLLLIQL